MDPATQPSMQLRTVGEVVRTLRNRRDLEQVTLAQRCGWRDASAVSRIETDRVRPTRRTLLKLAEALADPESTGTAEQVQGMLFLASGILPTRAEIGSMGPRLPLIHSWSQPAAIYDFGWHLWDANDLYRRVIGGPQRPRGRHLLELLFDPGHPLRTAAPKDWEALCREAIGFFRLDTAQYRERRWYQTLLEGLRRKPGFDELWRDAPTSSPSTVAGAWQAEHTNGVWGVIKLTVTADPRLWAALLVPEDGRSARWMDELAARVRSA